MGFKSSGATIQSCQCTITETRRKGNYLCQIPDSKYDHYSTYGALQFLRLKQFSAESGAYECYWQFMHNQRRFGHWLGCQVIVDPFDLKGNSSVLETTAAVHPPPRPLPTSSPIIPDEAVALKSTKRIPSLNLL